LFFADPWRRVIIIMTEPRKLPKENESLTSSVDHLLEECRMVLPGIQALFGFQLIAVFSQSFWEKFTHSQQVLHLISISVIAIAIALVMTPAAYHRQTERETISHEFVQLASRLLLWSMFPLVAGICLDFYLIASLILPNMLLSMAVTSRGGTAFFVLWFVLPRHRGLQGYMRR
jgi:DMSO reductase anchor subunit